MNFLKLEYLNQKYEVIFDGIKIIQIKDTNLFAKNLYCEALESKLVESNIFKNNVILISDFTKISDLITFNKSNIIYKQLIDWFNEKNIIDQNKIIDIVNEINNKYNFEILSDRSDIVKIISNLFELTTDIYLNKEIFISFLKNNIFDERQTFIFSNVNWLKIDDIKEFINNYNFIFINNDFRMNLNNFNQIESVVILGSTCIELADKEKVISYLESKINTPFKENQLNEYVNNKDSELSCKIHYHLVNI